jgi:hypothetical protein
MTSIYEWLNSASQDLSWPLSPIKYRKVLDLRYRAVQVFIAPPVGSDFDEIHRNSTREDLEFPWDVEELRPLFETAAAIQRAGFAKFTIYS